MPCFVDKLGPVESERSSACVRSVRSRDPFRQIQMMLCLFDEEGDGETIGLEGFYHLMRDMYLPASRSPLPQVRGQR